LPKPYLQSDKKEIVQELKSLLVKYISEGRSTPGIPQKNDPLTGPWHQINFID